MYQTEAWKIVVPKKGLRTYTPYDLAFLRGEKVTRSPELDDHIEEAWKIEKEKNSSLKNGPLLRLEKTVENKSALDLIVSLTDYQEYKATCVPEHKRRFEAKKGRTLRDNEKAHTFASAILPVTLDDKVVFLVRSSNVDYFKGMLNLPSGGSWDGNPEETIKKLLLYNGYGLFNVAKAIVDKEFNKKARLIQKSPTLYGIAETLEHGESTFDDHVLEFSINLDQSSDDIQRNKEKIAVGKYKDIEVVDFTEAALADFLNEHLERIPNSIQPVVIIAGAHKFGEDWPLSIRGVRKI